MRYEIYSQNSFIIRDEMKGHETVLRKIGARWNPNLKKGTDKGWLISRKKQKELDDFFQNIEKISGMKQHAKPRQEQDKYHRAVSDTESDIDDELVAEYCKRFAKSPSQGTPYASDDDECYESVDNGGAVTHEETKEEKIARLRKQLEELEKN